MPGKRTASKTGIAEYQNKIVKDAVELGNTCFNADKMKSRSVERKRRVEQMSETERKSLARQFPSPQDDVSKDHILRYLPASPQHDLISMLAHVFAWWSLETVTAYHRKKAALLAAEPEGEEFLDDKQIMEIEKTASARLRTPHAAYVASLCVFVRVKAWS